MHHVPEAIKQLLHCALVITGVSVVSCCLLCRYIVQHYSYNDAVHMFVFSCDSLY